MRLFPRTTSVEIWQLLVEFMGLSLDRLPQGLRTLLEPRRIYQAARRVRIPHILAWEPQPGDLHYNGPPWGRFTLHAHADLASPGTLRNWHSQEERTRLQNLRIAGPYSLQIEDHTFVRNLINLRARHYPNTAVLARAY